MGNSNMFPRHLRRLFPLQKWVRGERSLGRGVSGATAHAVVIALGVSAVFFVGCFGSESTPCGSSMCPEGFLCDEKHEICVVASQLADCVGLPDTAPCTVRGQTGYICDQEVCISNYCGDGLVNPQTEECDDGTLNSVTQPDACRTHCRLPFCGDGVLDTGEDCDEGPSNSDVRPGACRSNCVLPFCGDSVTDEDEGCDQGPVNSDTVPDACRTDCTPPRCGDGVTDYLEECDDANSEDTDSCLSTCFLNICGDGILYPVGEMCDDANATDWDGCTACEITEFQVNSFMASEQSAPAVAVAGDGSFVITWHSASQDGDGDGVFAQRFDSAGVPTGAELQVNSFTASDQGSPAIAGAGDGSFVITWQSYYQDGDGSGVFAQRFDSAGVPTGAEFQVNSFTTSDQGSPAIAGAGDGSFVITWQSYYQDGNEYGIFAQRFDSAGVPMGAEFQVNSFTASHQESPAVAVAGDGSFVITWQSASGDSSGDGIFAQRFDSAGGPVGAEFQVNSFTTHGQESPAIAVAGDGSFVITWQSFTQDGSDDGIFAQRFDSAGGPTGAELQVNSFTASDQGSPAIAGAGDGSFVITWQSVSQDGDGIGVFAQRFDSAGGPVGAEFQVNSFTVLYQGSPAVAVAGDGSFVITWESDSQDGSGNGVFAQRFDSAGVPMGVGN